MTAPVDVDSYLQGFPDEQREILERVRQAIRTHVPDGVEKIRYGMPAVMLGGRYALHFAGWKNHVGIYPVPRLDDALELRLAPHRSGVDSLNFPYAESVDFELIEDVTAAVVANRAASSTEGGQ
jgi:uncharacterized protein YdhG (YjbR/CyaY superfamily)